MLVDGRFLAHENAAPASSCCAKEGEGEGLNRYVRETFPAKPPQRIEFLDALNDLFTAWAGRVADRRVHAEA